MRLASTALERLAIALASLALSVGLIAILSGFFQSHDPAGINGSADAIGQRFHDLGHRHLRPGELRPAYDSDPPTSGAHVPEPILRDASHLSSDQELEALELGDVVIAYGQSRPPAALVELERSVAGAFTSALAATGQAVVLWQRPGTPGVIALAWTRMLRTATPQDPRLHAFAEQWLGRGAPVRRR